MAYGVMKMCVLFITGQMCCLYGVYTLLFLRESTRLRAFQFFILHCLEYCSDEACGGGAPDLGIECKTSVTVFSLRVHDKTTRT